MNNPSTLVYVVVFAVSLIFSGLSVRSLFIVVSTASPVEVYAFSKGGGGGPSMPQQGSGGGSLNPGGGSLNPGGGSGLPSGNTPSNTGSKNSIQSGPVTINPSQGGSANINNNPKVVTNPNTAVITNPEVDVNQNNVDVNVEGTTDGSSNNDGTDETNNYYYYPQTNTVNNEESTTTTASENPVVIYNNSIINPVVSELKMVGANEGANTISGVEDGKAGQTLELIGTNNKNYVQIKNSVNVSLSKEPIDLGQDDSLTLSFNDNTGKWIEKTHTDNSN